MQPALVWGTSWDYDGLKGRRREVMPRLAWRRLAERVPDLDGRQAPDLSDLTSGDRLDIAGAAVGEHADRRDLSGAIGVDPDPVPRPQRSGEHPRVGDLLPCRAAFDLEH